MMAFPKTKNDRYRNSLDILTKYKESLDKYFSFALSEKRHTH